jgi:DNA processing protein
VPVTSQPIVVSTASGPITVSGDAALLDEDAVAIVGARAASRAGRERATEIARALGRAGLVVMSGGAVGIDAAAHAGALARTVAVVAGGVCSPYPARNRPLFQAMLAAGGAVASPFGESSPIRVVESPAKAKTIKQVPRARATS